jgi:nitrate reductase assembly molybdenum cofactor insertion protein NarJ
MKRVTSAADVLTHASRWRVISLLLSRPTQERKVEVRQLVDELPPSPLAEAARAWCTEASEGAYLHLLGPGGLVPAREGAYRPFADPGWILADIRRHHDAFGFPPAAEEPPDHIAVLVDFVSYLHLKEAYALETSVPDAAQMTRLSRERFVTEHLSPVAARIAERLEACGATEWSIAARLLAAEVPPPPAAVASPSAEEVLQCGGCGAGATE